MTIIAEHALYVPPKAKEPIDMPDSSIIERERDADLKRIARIVAAEVLATAGRRDAEVLATAGAAATQLAATASQTATTLIETTRLDLQYIKSDIIEIKALLDKKFITVEAFTPVRNLVYGLVGLILSGVFVGLLTLIIRLERG